MSARIRQASISAIVKWWADNYAAEGWALWPQLIDLGEPCCWGCGCWADGNTGWGDREHPHRLERSHLVDHALGGDGAASNLVLLCRECNRWMPMFSDRASALEWVKRRDNLYSMAGVRKELERAMARRFS